MIGTDQMWKVVQKEVPYDEEYKSPRDQSIFEWAFQGPISSDRPLCQRVCVDVCMLCKSCSMEKNMLLDSLGVRCSYSFLDFPYGATSFKAIYGSIKVHDKWNEVGHCQKEQKTEMHEYRAEEKILQRVE